MGALRAVWQFLASKENRAILAWLGGGAVAAVTALYALTKPAPTPAPGPRLDQPTISAPNGVAAGVISGGEFNVQGGAPAPAPR